MRKGAELIGVVGLGLMGSALAERFLKNGFVVVGFDIDQNARRELKRLGGQPVEDAASVARLSRRMIFSLPTTVVVKEVIREMGTQLRPGSIIIDTTTGEPEQTAALGTKLAKRRIRYLDAKSSVTANRFALTT